jgi:hypothetical protein
MVQAIRIVTQVTMVIQDIMATGMDTAAQATNCVPAVGRAMETALAAIWESKADAA